MLCPTCAHEAREHSNLAGCTTLTDEGPVCPCSVKRRDLAARQDAAATVEALERVERGTDPAWAEHAEQAIARRALGGAPFTSDDLWFDLADGGVEQPREPRALGPIVKRALRDGTIRWEGFATSRRRHDSVIRSYVGHQA